MADETLMAQLRLFLPEANDLQLATAITLIRTSLKDEVLAEVAVDRERRLARERKRLQRQRDNERDISVTESVTKRDQSAPGTQTALMISHSKPPSLGASSPPASVGGFGGAVSSGQDLLRLSGDPDPLEARSQRNVDVMSVLAHYQRLHPLSKLTEKSKEGRLIRDRLAEGYSAEDLCRAIDGYHRSPHHTGENDRRTKYLSLELFMRDSKHVQAGIEFLDRSAVPNSKNGMAVAAVLARNAGGKL